MMNSAKHICWKAGFRSLNRSEFELELVWARVPTKSEADFPSTRLQE